MTSSRSCLGVCCDLVGSFFCPSKIPEYRKCTCISNTCRSYTLWGVLIAIFLTTGLMMGPARHYPRYVTPVADQMYMQDWFSNVWCDKVNVTTEYPLSLNAYLLDKADKGLCNQSVQTIKGPLSATIQADDIFSISLTLNHGDRISAKICMPAGMGKIYIFTRRMDFLQCIRSDSWTKCGVRGPSRFEIDAACIDYDHFDNPYLLPPRLISDYGEYYFVLYNRGSKPAPATIMFTKPLPNAHLRERALVSCRDEWLCKFNLGSMSEPPKVVCFEAIRSSGLPGRHNDDVIITCGPRIWLYMVGFLVFPLCIGIIGTIFICACCDKKTNSAGVPGPQRYIADYSRGSNNSSSSNRNMESTASRYTASRNVRGHGPRFDNTSESPGYYQGTDRGSVSRDRTRSLDLDTEPSNRDQHPNYGDAPPSYDEVMKGTVV